LLVSPSLLEPGWVEVTGFAAAFCTTAAFVPQLMRVLKLKSARDISLPTFLLFSIGVFLWLVYGIYTRSRPVILSNIVTLVLSLSILFFKIKYDRDAVKELEP
jgi:MtN3 and saliva related transmembrane protein